MNEREKAYRKRVKGAELGFALATRATRNRTLLDKLARLMLDKMIKPVSGQEERVVDDRGYDPAELARYERGETP
ncbi:hypothetical protein [Caulobacter segnis]|uniref:Uncharacterized protein n=1 Tax=Caulobacter segnis TaxID=88688 RepID=A0A2W5X701_9CAUL|nr:hypothetical protein [Caulobacter segnis]PZR36694.1 MAG: hypothetical protein DI526_03070 [Caulobacter segnis]